MGYFEPKTKTFLVINYQSERVNMILHLRGEVVEPSSTNQRQEKKNRSKRSDSIMTEKLSHFGRRLRWRFCRMQLLPPPPPPPLLLLPADGGGGGGGSLATLASAYGTARVHERAASLTP